MAKKGPCNLQTREKWSINRNAVQSIRSNDEQRKRERRKESKRLLKPLPFDQERCELLTVLSHTLMPRLTCQISGFGLTVKNAIRCNIISELFASFTTKHLGASDASNVTSNALPLATMYRERLKSFSVLPSMTQAAPGRNTRNPGKGI